MFPQYLQYLLTDFRQTFVTGVSRDRDDLITFWGQEVKVQGHAIAAEAHSTRRYRRVQLFLVAGWMHSLSPSQLRHSTEGAVKLSWLLLWPPATAGHFVLPLKFRSLVFFIFFTA